MVQHYPQNVLTLNYVFSNYDSGTGNCSKLRNYHDTISMGKLYSDRKTSKIRGRRFLCLSVSYAYIRIYSTCIELQKEPRAFYFHYSLNMCAYKGLIFT